MTEREWLSCTDPNLMLTEMSGRMSERKLRLFAAACCRRIWHLLPDHRSRAAVEVAERYADGLAGKRERAEARTGAMVAMGQSVEKAAWAAYWVSGQNLIEAINNICAGAVEAGARSAVRSALHEGTDQRAAWDAAHDAEVRRQAMLLHDILGNPFRPAAADPAWLNWRGGLLRSMARQIYDSSDFRDLPVLADALEDAGCTDLEVLTHCRAGSEHVRGCWALDLLLGKE